MKNSHLLVFKDLAEFNHNSHYQIIEINRDYFTHERVDDHSIVTFFSVPYRMIN